ncbi:MAG: hypothetical protein AB1635_15300 [Acidobacteriota bacterium]
MTARTLRALVLLLAAAGSAAASDETQPLDGVAGFFDIQVTGGRHALDTFGITEAERALTVPLLTRRLYGASGAAGDPPASLASLLTLARMAAAERGAAGVPPEPVTVPMPLSAATWRAALELAAPVDLFQAIVGDRAAALTASGLAASDPSVRAWFNGDANLLRWVRRTAPGAMSIAGRSLRLDEGRVATPGGEELVEGWQALAGASPTSRETFVRAILTRDQGRLAWFFDVMATLEPARLAAAVPGSTPAARGEALRALYASFRDVDASWRVEQHPFLRTAPDPWSVLTTVAIEDGHLAPPNAAWAWRALFTRRDLTRRDVERLDRTAAEPASIAWVTQEIVRGVARARTDRFEMLCLAQRVFGRATEEEWPDVLVALSGYPRFKALLLTLERMGVGAPGVWAAAVTAARHVDGRGDRARAIASFQAVVAIIERARLAGTLDAAAAARLVLDLARAVEGPRDVPRTVAAFIVETLVPALPPLARPDRWTARTAYESTLLQAMAGPLDAAAPALEWEGLPYRVDVAGGELERIHAVRARLPSPGLDAAIASGRDRDLVAALTALVYAPALGDPDGAVALGPDIGARHELGTSSPSWARRALQPWLPPRELMGDGGPWRLAGSLLGLDLALARLALRRVDEHDLPPRPTINLNDQLTIARTVAALAGAELADADRAEVVAALERGRARVARAGVELAALDALAVEARLSGHARQAIPWMARHTPGVLPFLFPLSRLLWLGVPALPPDRLDRFGVYGEAFDGRLTTVMRAPVPWEDVGGRADIGQVGTLAPDLILRLLEEMTRLNLPSRLLPALLAYAAQDYWHQVEARFADDWPAMVRQAGALDGARVEDYVAALAGRLLR